MVFNYTMLHVKKRQFFAVLFGVMPVFLSGCVSLQVPKGDSHYQTKSVRARAQQLLRMTHWQIDGALSIRTGKKADLANYTWQQRGQSWYRIRLSSALNLYNLLVIGDHHQAQLYKDGRFFAKARTPKALMQKTTGWYLPVSNLYYWVRGLSVPKLRVQNQVSDQFGHIKELSQAGWNIKYNAYKTFSGVDLPQVMTLSHDHLKVKIVMRRWALN